MAFARVIVDQKLADRLRHAISGLRSQLGSVGIGILHRTAAITGDAAGEDNPRTASRLTGRFKNIAPAIEIDAQSVIELFLAFPAHHGGEVKNREGFPVPNPNCFPHELTVAYVANHLADALIIVSLWKTSIQQNDLVDLRKGA